MKNGKLPTRNQKNIMKSHGLDPEKYLVVKNTQEMMEENSIKYKLKGWLCEKRKRGFR